MRRWTFVIVAAAAFTCSLNATPAVATRAGPKILTQDVDLFYRVYDAAGGHPSEAQLQHDYIDAGSDALHQFAKIRNLSGAVAYSPPALANGCSGAGILTKRRPVTASTSAASKASIR